MKFEKYLNEGIIRAGLAEAAVFVFEDYLKKYTKWMHNTKTKKPSLINVIKKVTKKFNSYEGKESQFTEDELVNYYIDYQLKDFKGKDIKKAREMHIESYGLDTLPDKYMSKIKKFIGN